MKEYRPTIGLEIHAELKTATKMFCRCLNSPDERKPNTNVCPVCMAHPGTLPVINKEAVKHVLRFGLAVGGKLADFTEWDRKNYFYPDIPKGYQISQYKYPLVSGGSLHGVELTRVHLEEDTARSQHSGDEQESLVDFNRSGVPLMELVTEPVIHSAKEAGDFARELQLTLRYLGISEANMEKGEMRVEANISVAPIVSAGEEFSQVLGNNPQTMQKSLASSDADSELPSGSTKLGTKVEVKNLNSFRVVEKAIEYEIKRQIQALEKGEKIVQETRGWDENKQATFSQRKKESSHDYRYFPDPDLPKMYISQIPEFEINALAESIPELPWQKRAKYQNVYGLKDEDIETYVQSEIYRTFWEVYVTPKLNNDKELFKLASNYVTNDLINLIGEDDSEEKLARVRDGFADLIKMIAKGEISSRGAKDILAMMVESGDLPEKIAKEKGLLQQNDETAIKEIVEKVISTNPGPVTDFKAGKEVALQFLVGQGMKESKGSANPGVLAKLIQEAIFR